MAEGKNSFVLYTENKEVFDCLTDEQAGKLIKHIFSYVNDENPILEDKFIEIGFIPIKQHLKRDLKKWEGIREKRSIAGIKSAEKRQQVRRNQTQHQREISLLPKHADTKTRRLTEGETEVGPPLFLNLLLISVRRDRLHQRDGVVRLEHFRLE